MTRWIAVAAVALSPLLWVPTASSAGPTTKNTLPLLSHVGRWLTDPDGRVVILHGVQVDKWEPNAPVNIVDLSPANVSFIASAGFNLVRLSMTYSGVSPSPGAFDTTYLGNFLGFDQELAANHIYDLLDMMQGEYSQELGGWGFPDWMTVVGSTPNTRAPFPNGYELNPAEYPAWDNFWGNATGPDGKGIQSDYLEGLAKIAAAFRSAPALLGVEVLNEPWPGSQWLTCANPLGCPVFDRSELTPFSQRSVAAVRSGDPTHLVAYEPNIFFNSGAATNLGSVDDANALFAFHNYCLDSVIAGVLGSPNGQTSTDPLQLCGLDESVVLGNAEARAASSGDGLLMDEWGNTDDTSVINRMTAEADAHMVGWSYWAYEDCCQSLGAIVKDGTQPPTAPGNLNTPVLDALVRPYPQIVAGTPLGWSYDPATGNFTLSYSTNRVSGGAFSVGSRTTVELPPLDYPTGYSVRVTGARVVSTGAQLVLSQLPDALKVTVEVSRQS